MSKEAMKLAQEWYDSGNENPDDFADMIKQVIALAEQPAPATELREQEPVSDRENAIIRFALHQFMSNAYSNMNAAAQVKDSRYYTMGAVEKFAKDAKDAEALLSRLQFKAPQPAQRKPWVGLTEQEAAECWSTSTVRTWQAIEAKLKEKNA